MGNGSLNLAFLLHRLVDKILRCWHTARIWSLDIWQGLRWVIKPARLRFSLSGDFPENALELGEVNCDNDGDGEQESNGGDEPGETHAVLHHTLCTRDCEDGLGTKLAKVLRKG